MSSGQTGKKQPVSLFFVQLISILTDRFDRLV